MFTVSSLNQMLASSIKELRGIGIPISDSISPIVRLIKAHSFFGRCAGPHSRANKSSFNYEIHISSYTLENSYRSVQNTIYHELLHTCKDTYGHDRQWKHYAAIVKQRLGYNIVRCGGDKTATDSKNLRRGKNTKRTYNCSYIICCPCCSQKWVRHVRSRLVLHPDMYKCAKCNVPLQKVNYIIP